jgi:hypothetical protein
MDKKERNISCPHVSNGSRDSMNCALLKVNTMECKLYFHLKLCIRERKEG